MTPAMGMLILQAALTYGPEIATSIAKLFSKPTHTVEDWLAIFAAIKPYDTLDQESKARVGLPPALTPSV